MSSTTSTTPAETIEEMVNDVGFQLEELEGQVNDVRSTIEDIVDSLADLKVSGITDSEKAELIDSLKWHIQSLVDEINNLSIEADGISRNAEATGDELVKLFGKK